MGATPRVRRFARPFRPLRGPRGTSPGIPHRRGRLRGPSRPGHSRRANSSRSQVKIPAPRFVGSLGPSPLCYYAGISDGTPGERRFAVAEGAARGRSVSRLNVLIAITAAIIGLIYGYDLGSIASALLFLVPAFDLSTFMTSVVTSAVVLGQLFGAFFAGRISNTIGRKRSLVLVALGYAAFAGLQGLAPNEWFLTVVRVLL